ncbi:MAG: DMT family transporter [Chthoniobacterales bacterium]|nr:DMT family transporter [Chthoniobacterales bacterium]
MSDYSLSTSQKWIVYLSLAATALGWGWSWVGIRAAIYAYTPGQLAFGRYLIASMVLLPVWAWKGARWPAKRHWLTIVIMGITGFSIYNFFLNQGEQTLPAGTTALIGAILPILIALGAWVFFHEKLKLIGWIGIFLAFCGVTLTASGGHESFHFSKGASLVILAMISASIYGLLMKRMLRHYSPIEITTWSIWIGAIALVPLSGGFLETFAVVPAGPLLNMVFLGIIPGALSYLLYAYAATKIPMAQVVSCMFFMPIMAIVLGWLFLGEFPSLTALAGGSITLFGAYLLNTKGKEPTPPDPQTQSAGVLPIE